MKKRIFTGDVQVEIQGPRVLRLLHQSPTYAEYEVIGFEGQIFLRDFRPSALDALDYLARTNDVRFIADALSQPAFALIWSDESNQIMIELRSSNVELPDYFLWIAVGLVDEIPVYDYQLEFYNFFDEHSFAFVSVFRSTNIPHSTSPSVDSGSTVPCASSLKTLLPSF